MISAVLALSFSINALQGKRKLFLQLMSQISEFKVQGTNLDNVVTNVFSVATNVQCQGSMVH